MHINYKAINAMPKHQMLIQFTPILFMCFGIGGDKRTEVFAPFARRYMLKIQVTVFKLFVFFKCSDMATG